MPSQSLLRRPQDRITLRRKLPTSTEDRVEKMSVMRKKIAEHMTFSKQTSAHVTSVYEIDMTNVAKFRKANKDEFQSQLRHKADVHAVHLPGGDGCDPRSSPHRQFAGRRRQDHLQRRHQSRHGGRSRLGTDRSGHQERRHAFAVRACRSRQTTWPTVPEQRNSIRTKSRAAHSRSQIPASSAGCSERRSSISRRSRSCASARSKNDQRFSRRRTATTTSRSVTWLILH